MISLNLLPDVKLEYLRTKKLQARVISIAVLVSIIAVGLVVAVAIWVYGVQNIQKSYLTGQIKDNGAKLKALPDIDKYLTIQNQLKNLSSLHAGKNDYSRLMTYLLELNPAPPQNVKITNLDLSQAELGNLLSFRGEVSNYTALNTFRDTLKNAELKYTADGTAITEKLFESVVVTTSSLAVDDKNNPLVVFTIDTTYNSNAFLASVEKPLVTVPTLNTTPSAQATPDVFGKSSIKEEN